MTSDEFRRLALALPGVQEGSHMEHPDFRANGKIFATLDYPDENWGMVKLSVDQQAEVVHAHPHIFVPVKGAWGRAGSTNVRLSAADESTLAEALHMAWTAVTSIKRQARSKSKRIRKEG